MDYVLRNQQKITAVPRKFQSYIKDIWEILKAISKQLQLGTSYGAPTSIESDTAKLIKKCVPSIQKIRMVNSGTEGQYRNSNNW